jgi:hypothetical protein
MRIALVERRYAPFVFIIFLAADQLLRDAKLNSIIVVYEQDRLPSIWINA